MQGMSFNVCSQCGFSHPPIPEGSKCPLAKEKTPSGNVIDFTDFFSSLKNILTSHIQQKDIKEPKKLFGVILVDITKNLELYKEK